MKTEFKEDDRVRVYGFLGHPPLLGTVLLSDEDTTAIKPDEILMGPTSTIYPHPKQCRKLVKKERRRVWISPDAFEPGDNGVIWKINPGPGYIEFVEVRKK